MLLLSQDSKSLLIWDNSLIKSITLTTDLKEWITENKATEFIEEYLKTLILKREPKIYQVNK